MAKKKRRKDKLHRQPQFLGTISEINEFFKCDLREDNWQEVIRTKSDEIWSPLLSESLRAYLETHRDKLDFEWAKLYLLFCKETLVKEDARRVLQLADQLSKYPPCYAVKLDVAEIYKGVEGKMRRAKKTYEDLAELDPRLPHGHHYLGLVLSSLGIYEKAAEEFQRAIEACREDESEIKARAHYNLGVLIDGYYRRDFNSTQQHLEEALRLMPDYPQARMILKQLKTYGHPFIDEPQGLRGWLLKRPRPKIEGRVGDVVLKSYWFPGKESTQRYLQIQCECWANTPAEKLGGKTPYESAIEGHSFQEIMEVYRLHMANPSLRIVYEQALRVDRWTLSYEQVYRSSGGLLNLLNEPASWHDDRQLQELVRKFESGSEPQEARKIAVSLWRQEPNELFSDLTPAQVWAGGGLKEVQLVEQFAELLTEYSEDRAFSTAGEMISQSLNLLRQWLLSPARGKGGSSRQGLIIEERNAILKRKIEILESKGFLESSFLL